MYLFVSDKEFVFVVPMKSKPELSDALKLFAKEIGVLTGVPLNQKLFYTKSKILHLL